MDLTLLRATRNNHLKIMSGLTDAQLNHIPKGFNNNLIWNAGHVIATMELLTYGLTGNRTPSGKDFINRYRKGTRPGTDVSSEEIQEILTRMETSVSSLEKDLTKLDASEFKEYRTSYEVTLSNLNDAVTFNDLHEAMHLGAMIALRKFV